MKTLSKFVTIVVLVCFSSLAFAQAAPRRSDIALPMRGDLTVQPGGTALIAPVNVNVTVPEQPRPVVNVNVMPAAEKPVHKQAWFAPTMAVLGALVLGGVIAAGVCGSGHCKSDRTVRFAPVD